MNRRNLLLVVLVAALSFGGSFTCHAHSGDDEGTVVINPKPPGSAATPAK